MTRAVKARELWFKMLDSQMETGTPYFLYKDAVNLKNNQMNLGTIKSSNLCTEIMEFSTSTSTSMISTGQQKESAVCNLASIGLRKFVKETEKTFDYDLLHKVTRVIVRNLNKVIEKFGIEKTSKKLEYVSILEDSLKEGGFLQKQIKKSKTYKKKDSKKNKTRKRRIY